MEISNNLLFNWESAKYVLFGAQYSQLQVDSINAILRECKNQAILDLRHIAYIFATAYHEAYDYDGKSTGRAQRLVPITEKGSDKYLKSKKYYPFIGRGFVQLTWEANYKKYYPHIKARFNVDILKHPEALLNPQISAFVLVHGMKYGLFTGKSLSDYFNRKDNDPRNARRIINGKDKAEQISNYYNLFLKIVSYG